MPNTSREPDRRKLRSPPLQRLKDLAVTCGVSTLNAERMRSLLLSFHLRPRSVLHVLRFEKVRRRIAPSITCLGPIQEPKIHLMYVTHEGDFELFMGSLLSLERLNSPLVGEVYVLEDSGKPLSARSKETLHRNSAVRPRFIRSRFPLASRGPALVSSELIAFAQIAADRGDYEYIAKTDSDTLFVSDEAFSTVLDSDADLLGHKVVYWKPFVYVQGGCYFLRCGVIPQMFSLPLRPVLRSVSHATWTLTTSQVPEDGTINELVVRCQGRVLFLDDLYFRWSQDYRDRLPKGSVAHLSKATKTQYDEFASWLESRKTGHARI